MPEYIDRDECRDKFYESVLCILSEDSTNDRANQIIDCFDDLPTADVQPVVRAQWEEVVTHNGCTPDYDCVCSNCKESGLPTYKYCPSCGSVMRDD